MMVKANPEWNVAVAVEQIPDNGLHLEIEAPASVLVALAKHADVRDVTYLSACFDLARQGAGVRVAGQVSAKVGQTCVVTLEPVENTVDEQIDLLFAPGAKVPAKAGEEPPEPLVDGKIDLGAIASEFFFLGIDPYPRKAGVEFVPPQAAERGEHPFAALETLKKRLGGGQS
jgi:Large ribosomal RNA subunit accumulation protein YceD